MDVDLPPTWNVVRNRKVTSCWLEPTDARTRELIDEIEAWRYEIRVYEEYYEGTGREFEIKVHEVYRHDDGKTTEARRHKNQTVVFSLSEVEEWIENQVVELSSAAPYRDSSVSDSEDARR